MIMLETLRLTLLVLAGTQALVMLLDEGIFHRARWLEKFERWGHVADTALFFIALSIPAFFEPTPTSLSFFIFFAVASAALITKDEWVHAKFCSAAEHWCHAVLFILHGALLVLIGIIWSIEPDVWELKTLLLGVAAWALYQHFYWNIYYVRNRD